MTGIEGLQHHIDQAVAAFDGSGPMGNHPSVEWLGENALDNLRQRFCPSDFVIFAAIPLSWFDFSDARVREYQNLSEDEPITDADRLSFMSQDIADTFENPDADIHPMFDLVPLTATNGATAFMGFSIRGYSFSGVTLDVEGLFVDAASFCKHLRDQGYLIDFEDFEAMNNKEKLKLWEPE